MTDGTDGGGVPPGKGDEPNAAAACPDCRGSGRVQLFPSSGTCRRCGGSGVTASPAWPAAALPRRSAVGAAGPAGDPAAAGEGWAGGEETVYRYDECGRPGPVTRTTYDAQGRVVAVTAEPPEGEADEDGGWLAYRYDEPDGPDGPDGSGTETGTRAPAKPVRCSG